MAKTTTTKKTSKSQVASKPKTTKATPSRKKTLEETVKALEERLEKTDKKLKILIHEVYSDMNQEMLLGPRGLARRISKAGLLE